MLQARWYCEVMTWMWTDWLDLPKLTTLRGDSWTFQYPRRVTLESDSHSLWMMVRHAQSHRCVSSRCILLQVYHNQRKYSLHPSLTNRHRSSSQLHIITERHVTLLFVPHKPQQPPSIHLRAHSAAFERALSLCEHGNNDDPHLKWWKSNQNRGNDSKWSFLHIARKPRQTMLQITHIASTFKSEANPNQPNPLSQSQKHHHSLSFHSYNPRNAMKSESIPSSTQSKSIIQTQLHTHQYFTSTQDSICSPFNPQ